MEKQEYSQLELFHKPGDDESSAQRLSMTFLGYIRMYERLVLMLIGLVITGVVCFCVGVEKGKRIALYQINSNLDIAYRNRSLPSKLEAPAPVKLPAAVSSSAAGVAVRQPISVPLVDQQVIVAKKAAVTGGVYTIQIGSYEGKISAQQELAVLKKQGLLPVIKSSGKYTVLCVGNFPDQATAKSLLTQLKRKYRDCYIRRL
jgi:hypothetical protein